MNNGLTNDETNSIVDFINNVNTMSIKECEHANIKFLYIPSSCYRSFRKQNLHQDCEVLEYLNGLR